MLENLDLAVSPEASKIAVLEIAMNQFGFDLSCVEDSEFASLVEFYESLCDEGWSEQEAVAITAKKIYDAAASDGWLADLLNV